MGTLYKEVTPTGHRERERQRQRQRQRQREKTKSVALTVVGLPYSKTIKRNNPKNLIVSFIKLKSAKKRQDSFRVCSFYIHGKAHIEKCASRNGKVEA